jgi:hypothetical protein
MIGCFFGSLISFPVWILELCRFKSRYVHEISNADKFDQSEDSDSV